MLASCVFAASKQYRAFKSPATFDTYKKTIQQSFESKKVFQTCLLTHGNTKSVFNMFHTLWDLCVKTYDNKKQLAAEIAMLRKKLGELDQIVAKQNCIIAKNTMLKKK